MKLAKLSLIALACGAPVAARAGFDLGINIGIPAGHEEVIVHDTPPPPQSEAVPPAPGPGYVWIGGHWKWHRDYPRGWIWMGGHWEYAQPGLVWDAGHWKRHHDGWVWVEGHWIRPAQVVVEAPPPPPAPPAPVVVQGPPPGPVVEQVVEAPSEPPAPYVETVYAAPGPDFFWIGGHWNWQGRWVWIQGRYERHPHWHPGGGWVDGHWDHRNGRAVWIEGRWR